MRHQELYAESYLWINTAVIETSQVENQTIRLEIFGKRRIPFGYFSSWYQRLLEWGHWPPSRVHVRRLQLVAYFLFDFDCLKLTQLELVVQRFDDDHWSQQDEVECFYFCLLYWYLPHVQLISEYNRNFPMMQQDLQRLPTLAITCCAYTIHTKCFPAWQYKTCNNLFLSGERPSGELKFGSAPTFF